MGYIPKSRKAVFILLVFLGSLTFLKFSGLYSQTPPVTIPVSNEPRGLAINLTTNRAVVTNHNTNTVTVANLTNNTTTNVTVGQHPFGVAINFSTNKAYIANEKSDSVSVLNLANNTVTATIQVGWNPREIAVNSGTNTAVVANTKSDTVSILNTSNNTVTQTVSVGIDPAGVVINTSNNRAFVTNSGSDTVSVIDLATKAVIATPAAGLGPSGIAINTTTQRIVIANHLSDTVTILNGSTNALVATVPVGSGPTGVAIDPTTNKAYITNTFSDSVSVIDLSNNTVAATYPVGRNPEGIAVVPSVNQLVVGNDKGDTVFVIDLANPPTGTIVPVGRDPKGVALDRDTNIAVTANEKSNDLSVIDLSNGTLLATLPVGKAPLDVAIHPTSKRLISANSKANTVSIYDLSTRTLLATVSVGKGPAAVAVDPALNIAVVANERDGTLSLIDLTTNAVAATISAGSHPTAIDIQLSSHLAVIANKKTDAATIIDLVNRITVATVAVGKDPVSVAINASTNIAAVANEKSNTLSIINLSTHTVTATINVQATPTGVAINPSTNIAAVVSHETKNLQMVDLSTNTVVTPTVAAGWEPEQVTINPDTNMAIVTNEDPGAVAIIQLSNPVPILFSLSPTAINAGSPGFSLTLNGSKFFKTSVVNFGGQNYATQYINNNQIKADIPASAILQAGSVQVTVTNPAPGGGGSGALTFTVNTANNPLPAIGSLSPGSATVGGAGFTLTVNGGNFLSASSVSFNGQALTTTFASSIKLTASVPASAIATAGYFPVTVINPAPGGGTSTATTFAVNNLLPTSASISPGSVLAGSGVTSLTVNGTNFVPTSVVQFNITALTTTYVSTTQLTATVPVNLLVSGGTFPIKVVNPAPGGGNSNVQTFTVNNPVPTAGAIAPTSVIAGAAGFTLTVNGTNFVSASSVSLNGLGLTTTYVSGTQLTAAVPASALAAAGTFSVIVTNPAPGGGNSNAATFTVNNPAPTLAPLSPNTVQEGSPGFALTLTGANFVAASTASFAGTALATTFVNSTQLTASVPASLVALAGIYAVAVTNPAPGGGSSNVLSFTATNPAPSISAISPTIVMTGSGLFTLIVNGGNFVASSSIVLDGQTLATTFVTGAQLTASVPASAVAASHTAQVTVTSPSPGGGISTAAALIVNIPPVADAGSTRSATVGKKVLLDGRRSSDADGNNITFAWTLLSAPAGSAASLANPSSVQPSLTPDLPGNYQLRLIVNDGKSDSASATVTVTATATNASPNADAGFDQTAVIGQSVTLDGRKSSDPDDDRISYHWTLFSAPIGSASALTDAGSVRPALTPDLAGTYVVQLIVNDGTADSTSVRVKVVAASPNVPPIARVGKDQNALTGSLVTLEGSQSRDPNGDPLTYRWSLVSVPAGSAAALSGGTTATPTFTPDLGGEYLVRLVVNDGTSDSSSDTVLVVAAFPNPAPNAAAGADQIIYQTDTVTLDGTGSFDPNGDPISYNWLIVSTPSGSQAAFSDPTVAKPTFVADVDGAYVIRLKVSDGVGSSFADLVVVKTHSLISIAVSPVDPNLLLGQAQPFTATGTFADQTTKDLTNVVTWSSSDATVAAINVSGLATSAKVGSTLIRASYGSIVSPFRTLSVNNPVPILVSLLPNSVLAGSGGFTLSLTGSQFATGATVRFGAQVFPATLIDSSHLSATIPAPSIATFGTVTVSVINPAPGGGGSNTMTFQVIGPVIQSFTPASGIPGTPVTISGVNFDPVPSNNKLFFNGKAAVITSATTALITTTVPQGATTGPITLTTPTGTATSATTFATSLSNDFSVTISPGSVGLVAGSYRYFSAGVTAINGFTDWVSFSTSSLPTGLSMIFLPPQSSPGSLSTVEIVAASTAAPGTYPITLTGTASIDGRTVTHTVPLSLQILGGGTTTLTGQILTTESLPLPGVLVTLGNANNMTDAGGNFFLSNVPTGHQMIFVDGRTANGAGSFYPAVDVSMEVTAGAGNVMPYIVYLPKIDIAHPINLPVDPSGTTTQAFKATTPAIPNMEVNFPAGTKITDPNGNPVSQITITAIPPDRAPMPFPVGVEGRQLFSIQPGGAVLSQKVPITFPNLDKAAPGTRANFYFFDVTTGAWNLYGQGTVSADGRQVVPDAGVGIPRFSWHYSVVVRQTDPKPGPDKPPTGGDPVDMSTGLFTLSKTDMAIPGRMPIVLTRYYHSANSAVGHFGLGAGYSFDLRLVISGTGNGMLVLLKGDDSRFPFSINPDGTYTNSVNPSMAGAKVIISGVNRILTFKDGTRWTFDGNGLSTKQEDRNGNALTFERGASGEVLSVAGPNGQKLTLAYTRAGFSPLISSVTDPLGRTVQYGYDTSQRLITVTDPAGGVTQYGYDTQNRMTTLTDARGITYLQNTYDVNNRVTQQTNADGGVFNYQYFGPNGQARISEIQPVPQAPPCPGDTITFNAGDPIPASPCRAIFVTVPGPAQSLLIQSIAIDPEGHATSYRFNGDGYLIEETRADGSTVKYERTVGANQLLSTTDSLGRKTSYTYDAVNNTTSITDFAGNLSSFTYEPAFSQVSSSTDALGQITSFTYDAKGNLVTTTDPSNATTQVTYSNFGQPIMVTDALGNTSRFEYDPVGALLTTTDPLGNITARGYDTVSRITSIIDPKGALTAYSYNILSRVTKITDAKTGTIQFTYDPNGNLLTVSDAKNQTTTYTYDLQDRLESRTDPLNRVEHYSYDKNGNLKSFTDRKGQIGQFRYDGMNRRIQADYADGSTNGFNYDGAGRLIKVNDTGSGAINYTYDDLNRLTKEITGQGIVEYAYDLIGRRVSMTANGRQPVTYSYDATSRPTQFAQGTQIVGLGYDIVGRRTTLTYPNGTSATYSYDTASRLTEILHQGPSGVIEDLLYSYDPAGNRTNLTRANGIATLLPEAVQAAYDSANEQVRFNSSTPNLSYDANGNLISQADANGMTTYTWDGRNRLVAMSGPGVSASFVYDALERRISKTINLVRTDYQYDGADIVVEIGGGAIGGSYLRALRVDEPFVRQENSPEYYHADALGSVLGLTNEAGVTTTTYSYEAFGKTIVSGTSSNSLQYTGRENDGTGLYYYRARYYSAQLDRFISPDPLLCGLTNRFPLRSVMRNSQTLNAFAYVNDSPINLSDPVGLSPECSYYDQRCSEVTGDIGKSYYCGIAKDVCEKLPRTPVLQCIRTCLQRVDSSCTNMVGRKDFSFTCTFITGHAVCFLGCTVYPGPLLR